MADEDDRARDLADKGLDKLINGDKTGRDLIDRAKQLDPGAVEGLAKEIERDKAEAENFGKRQG